jgi:hypothetical protein
MHRSGPQDWSTEDRLEHSAGDTSGAAAPLQYLLKVPSCQKSKQLKKTKTCIVQKDLERHNLYSLKA